MNKYLSAAEVKERIRCIIHIDQEHSHWFTTRPRHFLVNARVQLDGCEITSTRDTR